MECYNALNIIHLGKQKYLADPCKDMCKEVCEHTHARTLTHATEKGHGLHFYKEYVNKCKITHRQHVQGSHAYMQQKRDIDHALTITMQRSA